MSEVVDAPEPAEAETATRRPCRCETYARATEWAALAGARWLGRADHEAAETASSAAMAAALETFEIDGRVVIGADDGPLAVGSQIGSGGDPVDLALDPLEGRGVVARGGPGAMSMIAVAEPGSLLALPEICLLYTSPSPRDKRQSRMPSSA